MKFRQSANARRAGFTLVELLVVMGVISILIVISAAMLRDIANSGDLSSTADNIKSSLSLARSEALSQNRTTEFRMYIDEDTTVDPPEEKLSAYQIVLVDSGGNAPLSQVTPIPASVDAFKGSDQSTMMTGTNSQSFSDNWTAPAKYYVIKFSPNGSADSTGTGSGSWSLTLCDANFASASDLPDNYARVLLQPLTGRVQVIRPEDE